MAASLSQMAYIRKLATATRPEPLRIQGRNLPALVGLLTSTIRPMVMSVKASTMRATIIITPMIQLSTPMTLI